MVDLETNRRSVLQFLASNPNFGQRVGDQVDHIERATNAVTTEEKSKVHEVIWDLIVQRVLTVESGGTSSWAFLRLTEFGKEIVNEQRWSPYDPDGYLKALQGQAPRVFDLCLLYVGEALNCFRGGSYIATCVMLGAASEAAMVDFFQQLADAMRANGRMPEVETYERRLGKETSFYKRYELFSRYFGEVRAKIPLKFTDDLDGQLVGVFHLIRQYRNEAGHPTGTAIGRIAAFRNLTLFIEYCKRIEEISDWLRSNPEKLA